MGNDNYEDLVKCGYLEMKLPRKHRKFGRQAWKHKWFILRRKSSQQGYPRLEYFKSEEACFEMKNKTVVDLSALQAIEESNKSKTRKYTFKLAFTDTFIYIASALDNNMKEWVRLIKKLVLPKQNPTIYIPRPEGEFFYSICSFSLFFYSRIKFEIVTQSGGVAGSRRLARMYAYKSKVGYFRG